MSAPHITAEARAKSFLNGWQAEERFKAHRSARRRREALALQAGTALRRAPLERQSLPAGPAPSPRTWALLAISAAGLTVGVVGYVGIALLRAGWGIVTRERG